MPLASASLAAGAWRRIFMEVRQFAARAWPSLRRAPGGAYSEVRLFAAGEESLAA